MVYSLVTEFGSIKRFSQGAFTSPGVWCNNKVLSRCIHKSRSLVQQQGSLKVYSQVPEFGATTRFSLGEFTSHGVRFNNKVLSSHGVRFSNKVLSRCIH